MGGKRETDRRHTDHVRLPTPSGCGSLCGHRGDRGARAWLVPAGGSGARSHQQPRKQRCVRSDRACRLRSSCAKARRASGQQLEALWQCGPATAQRLRRSRALGHETDRVSRRARVFRGPDGRTVHAGLAAHGEASARACRRAATTPRPARRLFRHPGSWTEAIAGRDRAPVRHIHSAAADACPAPMAWRCRPRRHGAPLSRR